MAQQDQQERPNAHIPEPTPSTKPTPIFKIYLGGPDVFLPDPIARSQHLKALCKTHNLEGLFPLDNTLGNDPSTNAPYAPTSHAFAAAIRQANMDLIAQSDAMLANMSPFRGPGMDAGTAYEMGVAAAWKKPVVGYTVGKVEGYSGRVLEWGQGGVSRGGDGRLRDSVGLAVEEFEVVGGGRGLGDNLMMACGVEGMCCESAEEAVEALAGILRERYLKGEM